MTLNNLLLKQSKGTMLEGLARSVVRQPFQNLNTNTVPESKVGTLALLVFMIVLFITLIYVIPYCIILFINWWWNDKSSGSAIALVYTILILSYLGYALPLIAACFIFIIVLFLALFV